MVSCGGGRMKSRARKVVIFRDVLLPYSETFIAAQAAALRRWTPLFAGTGRRHEVSLPPGGIELTHGFVERLSFKAFRHAPARWVHAIAAHHPELVHAHFGPDGYWAIPLARGLDLPLVVTFHGYDATAHPTASLSHAAYSLLRPRIFSNAARVIAVSRFIADRLVALGCPAAKIVVHHIGVDTNRFTAATRSGEEPFVLFVGRLVEKKGCEYLIRAMRDVQTRHPNVGLVIVGDGPLRSHLEREASSLTKVRFEGVLSSDSVRDLMGRATVFCLPSVTARNGQTEGLPITLLEAQSMGLPAVSTLHAGATDAVVAGTTGFLVPERDAETLAAALEQILVDPTMRDRMSRAAVDHVRTNFDLRDQTARLEDIYDSVAAG